MMGHSISEAISLVSISTGSCLVVEDTRFSQPISAVEFIPIRVAVLSEPSRTPNMFPVPAT